MGANVFRLSEAQHDAYKARMAALCAKADGMNTALIGGVAKPVLETVEPSNTRAAEAPSRTAIRDAAVRPPTLLDASSRVPVALAAGTARSKYGNQKTDGYDSKKEAARAFVLRLMREAGEITGLVEQARFPIRVNGVLVCTYVCDFGYTLALTGERVVEDVKSSITAARSDYRIKKRLMKAVYGVDIKET